MGMTPMVIVRDASASGHRIYGAAAQGISFVREDIIGKGSRDQIKEAFDHGHRELSDAEHENIRVEQYQGDLRSLITELSDEDKVGGIDMSSRWLDLQTQGEGETIIFHINPQQFQNFQFQGVSPFIFNVTPLPSLTPLLGQYTPKENQQLSSFFAPSR
jgi:hypothetical protein